MVPTNHPRSRRRDLLRSTRMGSSSGSRLYERIEDEFQRVATKIIAGAPAIEAADKHAATHFFALWYMRARRKTFPIQEIQARGVTGDDLTKDQEENLEINGYAFARKGGKFPARQMNGIQLQIWSARYANQYRDDWGIIRAQEGEFIVSDVPTYRAIPITPTLCLMSPAPNGMITLQNVAEINRSVSASSHEYLFAKDFSKCPF